MKILSFISALLLFATFVSCSSETSGKKADTAGSSSGKIEAYYFHFTARCVTCRTIEEKTKENLEALYPQQVRNGLISFQSVNLDEESSKPLAQKLGIAGQTLLLVRGDQKINITNEGFMYAMVKPEKFREVINEKVELLLAQK